MSKAKSNTEENPLGGSKWPFLSPDKCFQCALWIILKIEKLLDPLSSLLRRLFGYFLVSVSLKRCIHQGTTKTNENKALDYFDYNERKRTRVLTKTTWGVIGRAREKVGTK